MQVDEIKAALKNLTPQERRKLALYILELEKEHLQSTVGPQLSEDLSAFSKVVQESIEKMKKAVNKI